MFEIFGVPSQALFGQLLLGLINGSFYALLSLGLAVIFGMLNIINFTHGAQYMMGAFAACLLVRHLGLGSAATTAGNCASFEGALSDSMLGRSETADGDAGTHTPP